ncbi:MAG: hypothetical protein ABSB15_00960 [Bryobacteraceae bacterium]|jgi:hypothetical protein
METGLQNFIWVGDDQLINLAYIVKFTVEDEGTRVIVYLSNADPENATVTLDGDAATNLTETLSEASLGKGNRTRRYGIESSQLSKITMGMDVESEGTPETLNPNATGE